MPLEAAGEFCRGSRAAGGEADGARCLAQRPGRPHARAAAQTYPTDGARGEVGSSARDAAMLEPTGDAGAPWRDRCRAHGRIPFRARLQRA